MKQIINYKVDELIPYDTNPRFHSDEQIEQVAKSIKEFGWTMPVLIDEHKELIAGHGRLMAAKRLGIKDVPCLVAQGWSEEQKKAYCIADNKFTVGLWCFENKFRILIRSKHRFVYHRIYKR